MEVPSTYLPSAITESDDYRASNGGEQKSLEARLRYCEEVAVASLAAAEEPPSSLYHAIDEMELDAFSIMSNVDGSGTTVSSWLIHSSWIFECDRQVLARHASADLREFLITSAFKLDASHEEAQNWLRHFGKVLQQALGRLRASTSYDEAITQLILIDAVMLTFLVFAASVRLDPNIESG